VGSIRPEAHSSSGRYGNLTNEVLLASTNRVVRREPGSLDASGGEVGSGDQEILTRTV